MANEPSPKIIMYTDGSSLGNPGPGGYGTLLLYGHNKKELSEGFRLTTNNRMELMAVIAGLEALKKKNSKVTVYTDSRYVVDAVEKGWLLNWIRIRFKGKKNSDLWMRFYEIYQIHSVKFVWVKGHAAISGNERCDQLAVAAANGTDLLEDEGFLTNNPLSTQ
ncbi:MAG: ribonuclease HI [Prolixibacteraceae bacterium]|jgi:ribonuclease HI|nr:ribonuclease HI [Prolixibacteraceae bacterium]